MMSKITKLPNGYKVNTFPNGDKFWSQSGDLLHKEDGPAVELASGYKEWRINGHLHREEGPAIEWPDGDKEWWLNDCKLSCNTQKQFEQLLRLKVFW